MRITNNTFRLLVCSILVLAASSVPLYGQERDRLISVVRSGMTPSISEPGGRFVPTDMQVIEVIELKVAGVRVTPGQPFPAGEDWLKELTARVKNISAKPISYIAMKFGLPEAKYVNDGREVTMGYALEYREGWLAKEGAEEMRVVNPGDEVELVYFENPSSPLRQQIVRKTGVTSISTLNNGGDVRVDFKDGGMWVGSNLKISSQAGAMLAPM